MAYLYEQTYCYSYAGNLVDIVLAVIDINKKKSINKTKQKKQKYNKRRNKSF